jgi:hypothetical protein
LVDCLDRRPDKKNERNDNLGCKEKIGQGFIFEDDALFHWLGFIVDWLNRAKWFLLIFMQDSGMKKTGMPDSFNYLNKSSIPLVI